MRAQSVATLKMRQVTEGPCGHSIAAATVSDIARRLDEQPADLRTPVRVFTWRPLREGEGERRCEARRGTDRERERLERAAAATRRNSAADFPVCPVHNAERREIKACLRASWRQFASSPAIAGQFGNSIAACEKFRQVFGLDHVKGHCRGHIRLQNPVIPWSPGFPCPFGFDLDCGWPPDVVFPCQISPEQGDCHGLERDHPRQS